MSYRERKPAEYAEELTADNEPMSLADIRFSNEMTLQVRNLSFNFQKCSKTLFIK